MRSRLRMLLAQFSVRDLLWLVVLAAVVSCWMRDRRQMEIRFAAERAADAAKLHRQLEFSAAEAERFVADRQRLRAALQLSEKGQGTAGDAGPARPFQP